jgi:hypothetical protein
MDWTALLNASIFAVTQVFMLVGLFGLLIPAFPGILVMWLAGLVYGLVAGFGRAGVLLFAVMTVLMIAGELLDNLFMGAGARKGGAAWSSVIVALAAGVVGTVLAPPIGGLVAAPLSVLLLEYRRQRDWPKAWQALRGLAVGWGLSFVARLGIALLLMILWWLWVGIRT